MSVSEVTASRTLKSRIKTALETYLPDALVAAAEEMDITDVPTISHYFSLEDRESLADVIEDGQTVCNVRGEPFFRYGPRDNGTGSVYRVDREETIIVEILTAMHGRDHISGYFAIEDAVERQHNYDVLDVLMSGIISVVREHIPCGDGALRIDLTQAWRDMAPKLNNAGERGEVITYWLVTMRTEITE